MDYINLRTALLKQKITNTINSFQLPVGITLFVLKDLVSSLEKIYQEQIEKENNIYQNQKKEENKNQEEKQEDE